MGKLYKLISKMDMKTSQIGIMVAIIMGNAPYSCYAELSQCEIYAKQRNVDMNKCHKLFRRKLSVENESKDIQSWIKKLCTDLGCDPSSLDIYHYWGKEISGGRISLEETLSSIVALVCLACDKNESSSEGTLDPKGLMTGWLENPRDKVIQERYVEKDKMIIVKDKSSLFQKISSTEKIPVFVIDDIYTGNFLGKLPGGFKNFFNRLDIYNNHKCETIFGGLFSDGNVRKHLRELNDRWKEGLAYLFILYKKNIYIIYYKKITK
ncbi:MAG: hypothetical protein LBB05_04380 [Puniceicoccales bacterium]|jgi:hypothetical protein|nr:hypothetical protein [Puniceicoccales bacterium]